MKAGSKRHKAVRHVRRNVMLVDGGVILPPCQLLTQNQACPLLHNAMLQLHASLICRIELLTSRLWLQVEAAKAHQSSEAEATARYQSLNTCSVWC